MEKQKASQQRLIERWSDERKKKEKRKESIAWVTEDFKLLIPKSWLHSCPQFCDMLFYLYNNFFLSFFFPEFKSYAQPRWSSKYQIYPTSLKNFKKRQKGWNKMDTGQQKSQGSDLRESKNKWFDPYEGLNSLHEGIFQAIT